MREPIYWFDGQDAHYFECDLNSNRVNHVIIKILSFFYNSSIKKNEKNMIQIHVKRISDKNYLFK